MKISHIYKTARRGTRFFAGNLLPETAEKICNARGALLKSCAMKKIASIMCLCAAVFGADGICAQQQDSVPQLKAKIAALETQIADDAGVISALRAEIRSLKKEIRKMKRDAVAATVAASDVKKAAAKQTAGESASSKSASREAYADTVKSASQSKVESQSATRKPAESSVWDHMFPF